MSVQIRPGRPGDGQGIARVWLDAGAYYAGLDPAHFQLPSSEGLAESFDGDLAAKSTDADTLRLADLRVPVLIQATPDDPKKMTIASRRDSFCGKMSACNNLSQYGIPYSLTTRHTEAPDSDLFRQDLEWFGAVCRVVNGFKNLRIGAIGARPAAFNMISIEASTKIRLRRTSTPTRPIRNSAAAR